MSGQNNDQLASALATTSNDDDTLTEQQQQKEPKQTQLPTADDSNILWDDTLIAASFDNQLSLLENSINIVSRKNTAQEEQQSFNISTESPKGESSKAKKKNKKHNKNETCQSGGSCREFTNKSQLFRFSGDNNDHSKQTNTSSKNPNETKRKEIAFTETPRGNNVDRAGYVDRPSPGISIMPPPFTSNLAKPEGEQEAHASMLMAWYVAGYHTGYYEAIKNFRNK